MRLHLALVVLLARNSWAAAKDAGRQLSEELFEDPRCECCSDDDGVPLSRLYKTEIHKNCFGGGGSEEIGWRLEDVLAQTTDGTVTVTPRAQRMVCASHRCRGSIAAFWSAVHECAASGYWKLVGLAFATAKSQCHGMEQETQESGQWLARIRATFHGIDTSNDADMLNLERVAEISAVEALGMSSLQAQPGQLEVKCSSVPPFDGPLGQDSVRLERPAPAPNASCVRVTSRWPADQEQGVAADLSFVLLHFDRCIRASNETTLKLSLQPGEAARDVPLQDTADLPAQTLVFQLREELGWNRQVDLALAGDPVRSCDDEVPICSFSSTFYTVVQDPGVVRTQLTEDRWLRSTFDLPVQVVDVSAEFTAKLTTAPEPRSRPGHSVPESTTELPLRKSQHLYAIAHERSEQGGGILNTTQCVYSMDPLPDRAPCDNSRVFEVDLCEFFSCKGSRLPCGAEVQVAYPTHLATRVGTDVPSRSASGHVYSRNCSTPHLLPSIEQVVVGERLQIQWSQPVKFAKKGRKFTVCHTGTQEMACPLEDVAFDDSTVLPCTGPGGDCAVWSIKMGKSMPPCGGLEVFVEAEAVSSVDDDELSVETYGTVEANTQCPRWAEGSCTLLDGDKIRREARDESGSEVSKFQLHLQEDLDRMHVSYGVAPWGADLLLRRLRSESFLPRCLIFPSSQTLEGEELSKALFNYVHLGGQLYLVGSQANIHLASQAFNLSLAAGETGNVQVRTVPSPSSALDGLPEQLPVLNQLLCVSLEDVTSSRDGEAVQANGIYSRGHVEPTLGWYGFGVLEIRVGDGFAEYLAFDWHHGSETRRTPWAKLMQMLIAINIRRWAPPPARRLAGWEPRQMQDCVVALPPADAKDLTCSFSYKCPRKGNAEACRPAMKQLTAMVSHQNAPLLSQMRAHCVNLKLQHFSPAFPVKLAERCPSWGAIDEATQEMKAACGFGYGPDASVLDVEVVKTNLGVEAFSSDMRATICQQSFCRGQIARMAEIFRLCPAEAGLKGERSRLARMLLMTAQSCTRAGGAALNVQDHFLVRGVNVLNPGEHDGLATAVKDALATQIRSLEPSWWRLGAQLPLQLEGWLAGVQLASVEEAKGSMITVNVHPVYPKPHVWSTFLGSADAPMVPAGQEPVAFVPQDLPGGACQGCSVRNLQVLAVHPAIGSENVDPAGVIRIFFDSVIVVDNPNAKIRIYPKALEEVCKSKEHIYYPRDTGTGDLKVATSLGHSTRMAPGIPVEAVCQVHRVSDASVKVGDEVLKVTPRHPLMRNAEMVVEISSWAVRAANVHDEERYPARWTGWEVQENREVFTFETGAPQSSQAAVSIAVGCTPQECAEAQQILGQASETLAGRIDCFLAWYRCSGDSEAPKICDGLGVPSWCDIQAPDWPLLAAMAPALDAVEGEAAEKLVVGEPFELRASTSGGVAMPTFTLLILASFAFLTSCYAVFRAAQWVMDEYLGTREFDPFLAQSLEHFPLFMLLALFFVPLVVSFGAAMWTPVFYHRALLLYGERSDGYQLHAAAEFNRLQAQMTWAACVGAGASACATSLLSYATIAMSRRTYFDLGQIVAIVAFVFSWGVILGGASNWIAETSPLQHAKMRGREDHFQVAVLTICCAAVQTLLAALCLLSVTAALVTLTFPGLGDILQFFLRYSWYQQTEWYDRQTLKPIGKWDAWVLHIRDLQLLHGFQVRLDGQVQEDGFITLQFYSTDDPFNVVATRTVPVRAIFQKNLNPLEGDNISLNISSWRSVVMANVMYQQQNGSYSQRVASAMWDPWTKPLLEKCFSNAAICDPDIGKGTGGKFKLWDFQDLMDDGLPKEGCYLETRVNLTPFNGLLSMQMTHLGPKPVLDERDDPSDQPSKELFLGDTIPSETIGFERRAQRDHQAAPTLSHHSAGAVASISGFATLDKLGIGGVDVELSDPGQQPKRYGENQGKQLGPFALEPSEWVVAVHQQLREAHPSNFGKALAFLTSAGHVFRLQSEAAIELQHLAAPRGFQIRRLNFEGSTLKDLTLAPVDGRGLARISWTLGEDVESVELAFRDGKREAHGRGGGKVHSQDLSLAEYLVGVTQEERSSRNLGMSLVFYTSKGQALRAAGSLALEDHGGSFAVEEGKQAVGLKWAGFRLKGLELAAAKEWK